MSSKPLRFVTLPISHYCEKVRWALERQGVPFIEEGHGPVLHAFSTMPLTGGKSRTVPILVFVKLAAFLWSGTYRGIWRYTSIGDLFGFAKGALVARADTAWVVQGSEAVRFTVAKNKKVLAE